MKRVEGDVREVTGAVRPGHSVSAVEPLHRGHRKRTAVVRFDDAPPAVIQRSPDRRAIETEAAVLRRLDGTSVPVPTVLDAGETETAAWLATTLVSGEDLHERFLALSSDDRRRLVTAFGRWLGTVHELGRFDRHGPVGVTDGRLDVLDDSLAGTDDSPGVTDDSPAVTDDGLAGTGDSPGVTGDSLAGTDDSHAVADDHLTTDPPSPEDAADPGWGPQATTDGDAWLSTYGRAHVARLPAAFDDLRPRLRDALADGSAGEPRLFPWDLRPGNALVADGEVTAVVDWEAPLATDPAIAVATTEYLTADWYLPDEPTADLRGAFREGYRSVRPLPTVEPVHRVIAVASSAVDSAGVVTNPGFPPVDRGEAVAFHRRSLERALTDEW